MFLLSNSDGLRGALGKYQVISVMVIKSPHNVSARPWKNRRKWTGQERCWETLYWNFLIDHRGDQKRSFNQTKRIWRSWVRLIGRLMIGHCGLRHHICNIEKSEKRTFRLFLEEFESVGHLLCESADTVIAGGGW